MKHLIIRTALSVIVISFISLNACKKNEPATGIDRQMYDASKETSGFTWFKNSSTPLPRSAGSGHSEPFLRTRYNSIAAAVLDTAGKIIPGSVFPDGSLVVKELINGSNELIRYAVLYKKPAEANADAAGWVWGYINADGAVSEPSSNKGSGCRGCHSQANHIDLNLMNIYYP